jgi:Tol biopolymer transport system component
MGEVFKARDTRLGRDVALKLIPAPFASDPARLRRFEQEARAVGALDHPNVLVVHDVGVHEGLPYLVTELLQGETLRERLRDGGLPPRRALEIAIHVARGLSAAHDKGIVHRDLKPENVFVTRDGRAKVLDFGLARMDGALPIDSEGETQSARREPQTAPGVLLGTVAYMSPEQARGRPADVRSDVFSLGIVLYEMLAGRRPFVGATAADTLSAILREDPPAIPPTIGPLPPSVDRVVRRCLEKEPSERFQTARDVGFALEALSQGSGDVASGAASAGTLAGEPGGRRRLTARALARTVAWIALGALLATAARRVLSEPQAARITHYRALRVGSLGIPQTWATDGERVYFTTGTSSGNATHQMSLKGGASVRLSVPFRFGTVMDASRERSSLLMSGYDDPSTVEGALASCPPLWEVPVPAGGARPLGLRATWAQWSPDGQRMAYVCRPATLGLARADGSEPRVLLESPDPPERVEWSPDGTRLRFGVNVLGTQERWIWEVPVSGGRPERLFEGSIGEWTPNGRSFVYGRQQTATPWGIGQGAVNMDLWEAREAPTMRPWAGRALRPLTSGPLQIFAPAFTPDGRRILLRGQDRRGALMRYDGASARFEPLLGGLSGGFLDYSWDGRSVAWVDLNDLTLWRSRRDGSEPLQLTTPPMAAALMRWSPDGSRLAFVARTPATAARIYVVSSDGGQAEPISAASDVWDPHWLPDGKTVVWGRLGGGGISAFDLETRTLSTLPGTEDLWHLKVSRQGLILAARVTVTGTAPAVLYDSRSGRREDLGVPEFGYARFSRDGQSVVGFGGLALGNDIYRFTLRERRPRKLVELGEIQPTAPVGYRYWMTLDPEDSPVILRDLSTYDLYVLDWEGGSQLTASPP